MSSTTDEATQGVANTAADLVRRNRSLILEAANVMRKLAHTGTSESKTSPNEESKKNMEESTSLTKLTSKELTSQLPEYMIEQIKEKHARTTLTVADDRAKFFQAWNQVILEFVQNPQEDKFECPSELSGFDRKELHRLAQRYNLGHHSTGMYPDRRLVFTKDKFFYQQEINERPIDDLIANPEKSLHRDRRPIAPYVPFDEEAAKRAMASSINNGPSIEKRDLLSRLANFQKKADSYAHAVQCSKVASSTMLSATDGLASDEPSEVWDGQSPSGTFADVSAVGTKWSTVLDPRLEQIEKAVHNEEKASIYPYNFAMVESDHNAQNIDEVSKDQKSVLASEEIIEGCGRKRKRHGKK